MGMTIEDCKKRLAIEKELAIKTGLNHDANGTLADAIDVAIDTMRKYQKIKEIMEDYQRYPMDCLFNVREVLEDGNDK